MSSVQHIGEAWLDENGTINMSLYRTADDSPAHATFKYERNHKDFETIMKHLGGLEPGEKKLVRPFDD